MSAEYKPVFTRYIGVKNMSEYKNILKTIYVKCEGCPYSILFDGSIPMQAEFDIIIYVGEELKKMNVKNLKSEEISVFDNTEFDRTFLNALDSAVNLAIKQETFFNKNALNDFIIKLIVWAYSYIRPICDNLEDAHSPKCFYYGDITRHEIYFLMILYLMGFDVVYINPLQDSNWDEVDTLQLSKVEKCAKTMPVLSIREQIENAHEIMEIQSDTLQMQKEIDSKLFSGNGAFRAWQFRNGIVKSLFIRSTVIDLINNYAEPAKVRSGFKTEGLTVTVPNYFFQIDGVYSDFNDYTKLVNICVSTPNTLVLTDRGESLLGKQQIEYSDKLKLVFCELDDGTYDIEELKKLEFYAWDKYRDALEKLMLNNINTVLKSGIFKEILSKEQRFDFVSDVMTMDERIMKMADNFDYTGKIPKLVLFLNNEDYIEDRILYLIGYIVTLGFDVIIFSPAGFISIDSVFEPNRFNNEILDVVKYNCTYEDATKKSKKGLLDRWFGGK